MDWLLSQVLSTLTCEERLRCHGGERRRHLSPHVEGADAGKLRTGRWRRLVVLCAGLWAQMKVIQVYLWDYKQRFSSTKLCTYQDFQSLSWYLSCILEGHVSLLYCMQDSEHRWRQYNFSCEISNWDFLWLNSVHIRHPSLSWYITCILDSNINLLYYMQDSEQRWK